MNSNPRHDTAIGDDPGGAAQTRVRSGDNPEADAFVRALEAKDIPDVVSLHRRSLSYSVNSQLGDEHLAYIYEGMMRESQSLVAVAISGGTIAGVVSVSLDPDQLKAALIAGLPLRRKLKLLWTLVSQPRLYRLWLDSTKAARPVTWHNAIVRPVLTAIAVDPSFRRRGIGKRLVNSVDNFVRNNGRQAYRLDTRSDAARTFYKQLGFQEVEQRGLDLIMVKPVLDL
jgi:ribosomal protein S18 acetylase RimI-like enzyme